MLAIALAALLGVSAFAADGDDPPVPTGSTTLILALLPDDSAYPLAIARLDYARLHLEARYNYEGGETGSVWTGINLSVGKELVFDFTPMAGFAFGKTLGILPGWELNLGWRFLGFYSEGEILILLRDPEPTSLYVWGELNVFPVDFARVGLVIQRMRAFADPLFFEPGAFVGLHEEVLGVSLYVLGIPGQPLTFQISVNIAM